MSAIKRWGLILLVAIIISILVILIGYFNVNYKESTSSHYLNKAVPVVSTVDGKEYRVHQNLEDSQSAADILATINETIVNLLTYLKYKYIKNSSFQNSSQKVPQNRRTIAVQKILNRYNPDNLIENSPLDVKGDTSYTMDKGSIIAFCLRDKNETHQLHNLPMLLFVAIHELAHVAIDDNEHPAEFWEVFKWLLMEAEEGGVYQSPNFELTPYDYCGMSVDYNPRFDNSVKYVY